MTCLFRCSPAPSRSYLSGLGCTFITFLKDPGSSCMLSNDIRDWRTSASVIIVLDSYQLGVGVRSKYWDNESISINLQDDWARIVYAKSPCKNSTCVRKMCDSRVSIHSPPFPLISDKWFLDQLLHQVKFGEFGLLIKQHIHYMFL